MNATTICAACRGRGFWTDYEGHDRQCPECGGDCETRECASCDTTIPASFERCDYCIACAEEDALRAHARAHGAWL